METFCLQFTHIQQPMSYCHGYSGAGGWAVTEYANPIVKLLFEEEWKYLIYVEKKKTVRMITTISQSPKFKAAIIIDVLPCLIL